MRASLPTFIISQAALGCAGVAEESETTDEMPVVMQTTSGLDPSRAVASLQEAEVVQLCAAHVATMESGVSAERNCDLTGVVNALLLADPAQTYTQTCQMYRSYCLMSVTEEAHFRCEDEIALAGMGCLATVGEVEACGFSTAKLRAELVPDHDCASEPANADAAVAEIYGANFLGSDPGCMNYATCRQTL